MVYFGKKSLCNPLGKLNAFATVVRVEITYPFVTRFEVKEFS